MSLGTLVFTWMRGVYVGEDALGNRYYRERRPRKRQGTLLKERRWVRYRGYPDGSKVPPLWNAWLHHSSDAVPNGEEARHAWEKPHLPNQTGTALAYRPPGSALATQPQDLPDQAYEAWRPS